jgi:hypothetical protein
VKQPRFPSKREIQIADDLGAALTRLDAALARTQISNAEHRRRFDAIGSWLEQRGVLFGFDGRGTLFDAWTIRRR